MSKKLIIVESPNKVKTISSFVGDDYIVMASVGHIRIINDSGKYNLGIDVDGDFGADFKIDPKKKETVKNLKAASKLADEILIATDPDREGECIGWHLRDVLHIPEAKCKRIEFHEITKSAVLEAINNSGKINEDLARSALTRAKLDKIIGYRLSGIVQSKTGGKSAGRVQSAALKIICEREKEIMNFVPKTYFEIHLPFTKNRKEYKAIYKGTTTKKIVSIKDRVIAEQIIKDCSQHSYIVKSLTSKERKVSSKPPFTTSTFQQECSSKLNMTPKKAMECAQKLFEGIEYNGEHTGIITYIRTDSTTMSEEFASDLKNHIVKKYGKQFLGELKTGKKAANAQEGHECLRCVSLEFTPDKMKEFLEPQLLKVYTLIYNRTLASHMSDAIITDTDVNIFNGDHKFVLTGHKTKFAGFKEAYNYSEEDEEEKALPDFEIDEKIKNKELLLIEKQTNPPSRYSEANLIKTLEDLGIGRPSTFASCVSVLKDPSRNYTELEGKCLKPTEKGMRVSQLLDDLFPSIISLSYTAEMESTLDKIAEGKADAIRELKLFYSEFDRLIKEAQKEAYRKSTIEEEKTGEKCPECGADLVYRNGRYNKFIACTNFPKCKHTEKIQKESNPDVIDTGYICPKCNKGHLLQRKNKKTGQPFYGCSDFPRCKNIYSEDKFKVEILSKVLKISEDKD